MLKKTTLFAMFGALAMTAAVQAQLVTAPKPAASAPATRASTKGAQMRQVQAACKKKVSDAGLVGDAGKQAMYDCMRNP